jgi:hypothetical protein
MFQGYGEAVMRERERYYMEQKQGGKNPISF